MTYRPSPVAWVAEEVEEVEHLLRTGVATDGRPVVLLSTTGARTGLLRRTPLMRVEHAGTYAAVASARGAERDPAWLANVRAQPRVALLDAGRTLELVGREATGDERARWWSRACTAFPSYATYQSRTRRRIPVVLLEPAGVSPPSPR